MARDFVLEEAVERYQPDKEKIFQRFREGIYQGKEKASCGTQEKPPEELYEPF